jgi:hypothetical protein
MNRRNFLKQVSVVTTGIAAQPFLGHEVTSSRFPIRTIYSNDTTIINSTQRPEVRRNVFTDEQLSNSIREAAGVDAGELDARSLELKGISRPFEVYALSPTTDIDL